MNHSFFTRLLFVCFQQLFQLLCLSLQLLQTKKHEIPFVWLNLLAGLAFIRYFFAQIVLNLHFLCGLFESKVIVKRPYFNQFADVTKQYSDPC